jgi:hypothetical protein
MRMSVDYGSSNGVRRRSFLSVIALPLIAFLLGIAAMAWILTRWETAAVFLGVRDAPPPAPVAVAAPPAPVNLVPQTSGSTKATPEPQRLVIDPETTRRVAQLEERVAEIDIQSRSAAGNANRAEGLLIALAARRALDRGVGLGYIEGLTGAGPDQNWWTALKTELSGVVTVRRAGTTSTMPAERMKRASRSLEAGQVDIALLEVLRMPGRERAEPWINEARRYVAARRALDAIETAALLEPHAPLPTEMSIPAPPAAAKRVRRT